MSHSNFKLITNDEPINRNLIIIVNKNGEVGTDTLALQNLLTSRETPETGVTVIRETSPTPSISDEIENERIQQNEILRQQYIAEHPNATEEEIDEEMEKIIGIHDVPHVSLNVENFYAPDQARKFANDVLHLGGIENPSSLLPIDYNFRRQIIQNDHCYTPFTYAHKEKEKPTKAAATTKAGTKEQQKATTSNKKETNKAKAARQVVKEEEESSDEEGGQAEEEQSEEQSGDEEMSFSESDDDNDMDFSVNDRFGKKGKKKRKYRRQKQKSMTFKDFLEGGADMSSMDEEPKKKYGKSPKKAQIPKTSGKSIGPSTSKNTQQSGSGTAGAGRKNTFQGNKSAALRKEVPAPVNNKPNISQISIQSAAPAKSTQEIEFVESIVKDLEKSFPENNDKKPLVVPTAVTAATTSTNSIPNIMQMMETNTPTEVIDQSLSTLEHIDGNVGIEEIGDAIIAALGNEAIDELLNQGDLMNFDSTTTTSSTKPAQNIVTSTSSPLQLAVTMPIIPNESTSPLAATSSLPKILNRQAPIKDPIKVVRNGRVITLPPIEAPTTRGAKRRAQGDSLSPVNKHVKPEVNKTPSTKDPDSRNSSRRSSLNKSESSGRNSRRQSTTQGIAEEDESGNSDASWNSEDDPDRLWCICKQPHNNRFMICCDKCEDWFHGTCVNVTKAMGKDMEKKEIKWHCPNCKSNAGAIKKDPNKKPLNQQKLTKFFSKNMKESTDEDVPAKNSASLMCAVCHKKPARTDSIYCSEDCIRNHATKHLDDNAQPKTPTTPTASTKLGDGKRGNVLKDQSGNVSVYDKTTGKLLSAKLWPHITNLGQWLQQNPNCEPVKPGSHHATQLLSRSSKNSQAAQQSPTQPSSPAVTSTSHHPTKHHHPPPIIPGDELFSNPIKINTGAKEQVPSPTTQKKLVQSTIVRSSTSLTVKASPPARPPLQKQSSVSSSTSSKSSSTTATPKVQETKKIKRQASDEKPQAQSTPLNNKSKIEYERMNVRNMLKSTLLQRMKDIDDPSVPKMSEEEVEKYATAIEREMFIFFNKDTRDKYKVKFRSLKFNLSDTKNKTLIERICLKKFTPKQLVELPSSELASKELSKWREEENKHQLEIITKAELDALAQNKMVLKTHKGEEIIETKTASGDISLPDDDVESVIEKSVLSVDDPHGKYDLSRSILLNVSGNHSVTSPLSSPSISSSTGRKSDSHHDSRSRSKSRGRDSHHHHHKSSSSKHKKSEHRHRSRSPRHHHSSHHSRDKSRDKDHHSRDKSRDREHHNRDKSRDREHHSSEHHSRDKSRDRDHSKKRSEEHSKHHRDKSRSNEKDKSSSSSKAKEKDSKRHHHSHHHKDSSSQKDPVKKEEPKPVEIKPEQEDVDIVGKILDSMGVHLDTKPKTSEDEKTPGSEEVKSEVTSSLTLDPIIPPVSLDPINEHQLEIEIYSGNMYMADVAKFDVTASVVSGNVDDIIKMFNPQMEIVGRIEPKTVWDYLGKVKKLPGKELAVIRFSSSDESAYFSLFSYLHSRQRYGVIKSPAPIIKDFYLITVEANRPLPPVLLPIVGPGFIEGEDHKPDLLLGVILKLTPESRHVHKKSVTKKVSKSSKPPVEHIVPIQILPPKHHKSHSHSSNKLTAGLPELRSDDVKLSPKKSPISKDDDEPYTPFDDDDSLTPPRIYGQHSGHTAPSTSRTKMNTSDDLESQMEQLNREIERRQMEIQTLAQQKALELNEEQASKIFEKISVPHNLSEILSTIKASEPSSVKPMEIDDDDDDEEYIPIAGATKAGAHEYRASSSYAPVMQQSAPIVNSMMDIDERINLFRQEMPMNNLAPEQQPSRLANMSDADLLTLIPEDALQAPPPPIISSNSISEPAIPGLEYEMEQ